MNSVRLIIGAGIALVVTLGLFLLMPALIESADKTLDEKKVRKLADITMPDRDIDTNLKESKPEKPEDPEEPPPDIEPQEMEDFDIDTEVVNLSPQASFDLSLGLGKGLGGSDGEYLPIVKVAPIYPRRATTRGIEGYCIVEYTVTKTGSTTAIKAVDCQPSGVFERASVKAAAKFKYKPRVIDGEPIDVAGVRNMFTYELEK